MLESLKKAVFEANLELVSRGLVMYTWGNVSAIDRASGLVVIKPSGVAYDAMKADDMVVLSLADGSTVEGSLRPSSDAPTHLELYRRFPTVGGITHTHSTHATAWAQARRDLKCFGTTHADHFHGDIPCTRELTADEVEAAYEHNTGVVIAETFAKRGIDPLHTPAVLVASHGPFAFGKDAAASVFHAAVLEEVARMAQLTLSIDPSAKPAADYVQTKHFLRKHGPNAYYGQK